MRAVPLPVVPEGFAQMTTERGQKYHCILILALLLAYYKWLQIKGLN